MGCAITIIGTVNGKGFDGTLQSAMFLLRSNHINVEGAAHVLTGVEHVMTVLIGTETGRSSAIEILAKAGFRVKPGAV